MISPKLASLFERPIEVSHKDTERLSPYLSHWNRLHRVLAHTNEPDLKRLILIELSGQRRKAIIDRLLMRLGRIQRRALEEKISRAVRLVTPSPRT